MKDKRSGPSNRDPGFHWLNMLKVGFISSFTPDQALKVANFLCLVVPEERARRELGELTPAQQEQFEEALFQCDRAKTLLFVKKLLHLFGKQA